MIRNPRTVGFMRPQNFIPSWWHEPRARRRAAWRRRTTAGGGAARSARRATVRVRPASRPRRYATNPHAALITQTAIARNAFAWCAVSIGDAPYPGADSRNVRARWFFLLELREELRRQLLLGCSLPCLELLRRV